MPRAFLLRTVAALLAGAVLAMTPLAGIRICTDPAKLDCCPEERATLTASDCACCFQLAEASSGRTVSEKGATDGVAAAGLATGDLPPKAFRAATAPVIAASGDPRLAALRAVVLII